MRTDPPKDGGGRWPASPDPGEGARVSSPDATRPRPSGDLAMSPAPSPFRLAEARRTPLEIRVPGVARDIRVKIASERGEWRDAFQLVSCNYQEKGYEEP